MEILYGIKCMVTSYGEVGTDILATPDGGYLIVGEKWSSYSLIYG